ncbi:MAG: hypothetical protein EOP84_09235 [Verrucomicrobiaceae bacterium]|nr:MAG: hypothetical protein EOP84_09235 [Verrucomicrobiaceae bacterium]
MFRQQDVTERCIATLRAAKVDPTVGQSLAERMIEIAGSSGWIVISHRGVRNIKFWTWAHPVETISAVQSNHP